MKRTLGLTAAMLCSLGSVASASVSIVGDPANSTSNLGNFAAALTYLATDDTSATLTIDITNTSAAANGGFLTALAFVNPGEVIDDVSVTSTLGSFDTLLGAPTIANGISVSPFGDLDIGVSTSDSWLGGGNPNAGLGVGEAASFTFTFGADSGLLGLTELSFLAADADSEFPFLVRFHGFEDEGSDKVPSEIVPETASLAVWTVLALTAFPAVVWSRRRYQ
jgi:hypothetical protein